MTARLVLAKEHDVKRRDRVCAELHFNMCKEMGVKLDSEQWYDHVPKSVETSHEGKVTVLWNQQLRTDRTIPNNKPDIIIRCSKKVTCVLIDVANSGDRNVIKKEAKKVVKYETPHNRNSAHVECKSKSETSNKWGDWKHFTNTQTVPEQHTKQARN